MSEGEVKKCPKCSGEMENHSLRGYGGVKIEIAERNASRFAFGYDKVIVLVCKECGFIELYKERKL